MTSYQSPTILKRFLLSLMLFFLSSFSLASSKKEEKSTCSSKDKVSSLRKVDDLIEKSKLIEAESCLKDLVLEYPKDRDISFKRARILSWLKRFPEAESEILRWKANDPESLMIKGDISWYKGHCRDTIKFYSAASKKIPLEKFERSSLIAYEKCLKSMKDSFSTDYENFAKQVRKSHPNLITKTEIQNDPKIGSKVKEKEEASYSLDDRRSSKSFVNTEYLKSFQTESNRVSEYKASLSLVLIDFITTTFEAKEIMRDFGTVKFDDQLFTLGSDFTWSSEQKTLLQLSYSYKPRFSYNFFAHLDHQISLNNLYFGLGYKHTSYPDTSVNLFSPYIGYYLGAFHLHSKFYYGLANKGHSQSGLLKAQYFNSYFNLDLWLSGGYEEASRSYLINKSMAKFLVWGSKFQWVHNKYAQPYLIYEGRVEEKFLDATFKIGSIWKI